MKTDETTSGSAAGRMQDAIHTIPIITTCILLFRQSLKEITQMPVMIQMQESGNIPV